MTSKKETFASVFESLAFRYDLRTVFDDFLTITLCAYSRNRATGLSYNENLYLEIVGKYPVADVREVFPKLLACLILEMEERVDSDSGNDVLGEWYELNFLRKQAGQFFTPWHLCELMGKMNFPANEPDTTLRIIDPTCGSGRMLLASAKNVGTNHEYYGIDIDHTCVKMTVLNLFLNGIFHGEVMWADALDPSDFRMSYALSFLPFGIFRIENKEHSRVWQANQTSGKKQEKVDKAYLLSQLKDTGQQSNGSQLNLF